MADPHGTSALKRRDGYFTYAEDLNQDLDQIDSVTQPDIPVVCDPDKLIDRGVKVAPNLIIEILSPSTDEYLIVNPESYEVLAYRYDQAKGLYGLPAVADLGEGIELRSIPGLVLQAAERS